MSNAEFLNENHPIGRVAAESAAVVDNVLMASVSKMINAGDRSTPHHLYVAIVTAAQAIQFAAKLMTMPEEEEDADEWAKGAVKRSGILAAALLVARCTVPRTDGNEIKFNPANILAAMEAVEKLLGRNCDKDFTPAMVNAARKQASPQHFFDNGEVSVVDLSQYRTLN